MERINKLLTLFLSSHNKFWNPILGANPKMTAIAKAAGFSLGTIYAWRNNQRPDDDSLDNLIINVKSYIDSLPNASSKRKPSLKDRDDFKKKLDKFHAFVIDDNIRFHEVADLLGYEIDDAQRIIDASIYNRFPLLSKAYIEDSRRAREMLDEYKGIYIVHMQRASRVFQCTLRVRYALEIGDGTIIRCKLNVPNTEHGPGTGHRGDWEYDGFVVEWDNTNFWCFEMRGSGRADFIFVLTGRLTRYGDMCVMGGNYMTTAQDTRQSIVGGKIRFEYLGCPDWAKMDRFMDEECKLLSGNDAGEAYVRPGWP